MICYNFSQLPTPPGSDSAYSPDQQNGNFLFLFFQETALRSTSVLYVLYTRF